MRKYIVHPNKTVSFSQLCKQYGVKPSACYNASDPQDMNQIRRGQAGLINLYVRKDGDYKEQLRILEQGRGGTSKR